jgi:hypothetical protein
VNLKRLAERGDLKDRDAIPLEANELDGLRNMTVYPLFVGGAAGISTPKAARTMR